MADTLWTAAEIAGFGLIVAGLFVLWGAGLALLGAGVLVSAVTAWRAFLTTNGGHQ